MNPDDIKDILKKLDDLQKDVDFLRNKRITQVDVVPDSIKQRAMGESNRWVRGGLAADRPTMGEPTTNGYALYWAYDTGVLSIWDSTQWLDVTLT